MFDLLIRGGRIIDGTGCLRDGQTWRLSMVASPPSRHPSSMLRQIGFTTSRTLGHASLDGTPVPGTFANDDELFTLAKAVRKGGGRIFEVAGAGIAPTDDAEVAAREMDWIGALARETGLTATFIVLQDASAAAGQRLQGHRRGW